MELQDVLKKSGRDAESVREFFNGWSLYRRIVDNDYLYHRSAREVLATWLDAWVEDSESSFTFLDLGCGDAAFSSGVLKGRNVAAYTGMDLSPVALDLARGNTSEIAAPVSLVPGDFMLELGTLPSDYDIIYIGLSLHHLSRQEKEYFFGELRRKVAPGGAVLIFDPVLTLGESRDSYMGRWVDHAEWSWRALSVEEVAGAVQHVTSSDFPEEIATLNRMAIGAGFKPAEVLFMDRTDFYALMAFRLE
jgi:ubiquinone/menaquinone biosynthesis C-methylase UbiE